jgi:cytoskeletal protein RodZ
MSNHPYDPKTTDFDLEDTSYPELEFMRDTFDAASFPPDIAAVPTTHLPPETPAQPAQKPRKRWLVGILGIAIVITIATIALYSYAIHQRATVFLGIVLIQQPTTTFIPLNSTPSVNNAQTAISSQSTATPPTLSPTVSTSTSTPISSSPTPAGANVAVQISILNIQVACISGRKTGVTLTNPSSTQDVSWSARGLSAVDPKKGTLTPKASQSITINITSLVGTNYLYIDSGGTTQTITIVCL